MPNSCFGKCDELLAAWPSEAQGHQAVRYKLPRYSSWSLSRAQSREAFHYHPLPSASA
jgi:hypothetical protein